MSLCPRSLTLAAALACVALHTGCTGGAPSGGQPDSNGIGGTRAIKSTAPAPRSPIRSTRSGSRRQKNPSRRPHQLSVARIGRGHQAADERYGVLRCVGWAHERRTALDGARPDPPLPHRLGAVVPVYNIPGVGSRLKFTGPLLANIILGKIRKWNDPAIVKQNAGVKLPGTDITVVHRPKVGHDVHLRRLSRQGVSRVQVESSVSTRR